MRLLAAALAAALCCAQLSAAAPPRWHELQQNGGAYGAAEYVRDFERAYATSEEAAKRAALIEERLAAIRSHNAGTSSFKKGVNEFTDRTEAELARLRGVRPARLAPGSDAAGLTLPLAPRKAGLSAAAKLADQPSIDWRTKGVVTAVKNQGGCGSCWAFAATEAVESAYALTTGRLEVLSPQQILDCTPNPGECGGDGGCTGGTPELAFAALVATGGLASEWTYPYLSYHGGGVGPCRFARNATPPVACVDGFTTLPRNEYWPVLAALGTKGPLAVNVDASAWFEYESGVFDGCSTASPDIDHAVTAVGYGTDPDTGRDYWLIRNSWGTRWGEGGYMRLARSATPTCASDVTPFDGSDCRNVTNPVTSVTVCGECGILYDVSVPSISRYSPSDDDAAVL